MLLALKTEILRRGIRQTRMAIQLGWDPSKLSRIVNELAVPTAEDRRVIAGYLKVAEVELFEGSSRTAQQVEVATETGG